jgi:hypothetical protein
MAIILKANKVNLFVYSVLFVFWYHSLNVLDTPRIIISLSVVQCHYWHCEVCGIAVSVETWPWARRSGDLSSIPDSGKIFFLLYTESGPALGLTQPLVLLIEEDLSSGVKLPVGEVNYSPPSSAALKNEWGYTSTPPHALMT